MIDELSRDVLDAAILATESHAGQTRKKSTVPYVIHPFRVARRVAEAELSAAELRVAMVAAILHDTLEDTELPRLVIARRFGDDVLAVVEELTQDRSLPKAERRARMIADCGHYSRVARIVKLADRWDNMSEMQSMDAEFVQRYCDEAEQMLKAMSGTWPAAEEALWDLVAEGRERLDQD